MRSVAQPPSSFYRGYTSEATPAVYRPTPAGIRRPLAGDDHATAHAAFSGARPVSPLASSPAVPPRAPRAHHGGLRANLSPSVLLPGVLMSTCVPSEATAVLHALRDLALSIVRARRDGSTLAQQLQDGSGRHRWVVDQREGFISLGLSGDRPGDAVVWLETIDIDMSRPQRFGALASVDVGWDVRGN